MTSPALTLRAVKLAHTIVWGFFVACIAAIPVMAWQRRHVAVVVLGLVVFAECLVLILNRWRCPLTDVAARYTAERGENFDIYLPRWLARYNKVLFGGLYLAGLAFALARWRGWI